MFDFSPMQIIIVLVIALLVLGPKRLPSMAKSLGHGLRGFRDSLAGNDEPDELDGKALAVATKDEVDEREALIHLQPVESVETPSDEQEALIRLQPVEPAHSAG